MEYYAKIIHKAQINYLPTNFPVHFYGMPNGKVFFVYARSTGIKCATEYVFAEHMEFSYDYAIDKLILYMNEEAVIAMNNELVDKPNPEFKIFKIFKKICSYTEAFYKLNRMAQEIINDEYDGKTILLEI